MRVLVITNMCPTDENPAFGCFVQEQFESLGGAGVDADLYFIRGYRGRWAYARAVRELRRRRRRYDAFHAHHCLSAAAAIAAAVRPLAVTVHDNAILTNAAYRRFARAVVGRADRFVAVSAAARDALAPIPAAEIPMGVNVRLFHPRPAAACRRELGLDPSRKYALFPAEPMRRTKRLDLAREAVALARAACLELELLVMTRAPRAAVPLYFNAADVALITSDLELGPITAKEAVACGKRVVSRRVGDVGFLDKCPSCYCVGDNAREIADGILAAVAAGTAPPFDFTGYTLDDVARSLAALYAEIAAGREPRPS